MRFGKLRGDLYIIVASRGYVTIAEAVMRRCGGPFADDVARLLSPLAVDYGKRVYEIIKKECGSIKIISKDPFVALISKECKDKVKFKLPVEVSVVYLGDVERLATVWEEEL